jgi:hypothetical protein
VPGHYNLVHYGLQRRESHLQNCSGAMNFPPG